MIMSLELWGAKRRRDVDPGGASASWFGMLRGLPCAETCLAHETSLTTPTRALCRWRHLECHRRQGLRQMRRRALWAAQKGAGRQSPANGMWLRRHAACAPASDPSELRSEGQEQATALAIDGALHNLNTLVASHKTEPG
jgi:hypothetical protein